MPNDENSRDECLAYFRKAVTSPDSVPPWSDWWKQNESLVEEIFPLMEYVRLKHRRLLGARQILQAAGELPLDYQPLPAVVSGTCPTCGDRVQRISSSGGELKIQCPNCGSLPICSCESDSAH